MGIPNQVGNPRDTPYQYVLQYMISWDKRDDGQGEGGLFMLHYRPSI